MLGKKGEGNLLETHVQHFPVKPFRTLINSLVALAVALSDYFQSLRLRGVDDCSLSGLSQQLSDVLTEIRYWFSLMHCSAFGGLNYASASGLRTQPEIPSEPCAETCGVTCHAPLDKWNRTPGRHSPQGL